MLTSLHNLMSLTMLISQGLDHEEEQRRIRAKKAGLSSRATDLQKGNLIVARNALHRGIEAWQTVQHLYMPTVAARRTLDATTPELSLPAEDLPLYLPSDIVGQLSVEEQLLDIVWEFRIGLAHDALEDLRRLLCARQNLLQVKKRYLSGQRYNTRANGAIKKCEEKMMQLRRKYDACYDALTKLAPALDWRRLTGLQRLEDNDVWHMSEPDPNREDEQTEGTREVSWIWTTRGARSGNDDEDQQEMLRIEWCKARARAHRWSEECQLLEEEMRRVVQHHDWQADWWEERAHTWEGHSQEHREGLVAYAYRQAEMRRSMSVLCTKTWADVEVYMSLGQQI